MGKYYDKTEEVREAEINIPRIKGEDNMRLKKIILQHESGLDGRKIFFDEESNVYYSDAEARVPLTPEEEKEYLNEDLWFPIVGK